MADIDRIVAKVDVKLAQRLKKNKEETVSELKSFFKAELLTLEEKLSTRMRELEENMESRIMELEEKNDELTKTVEQIESENSEVNHELKMMRDQMLKIKSHAVSNEQYSRKNNVKIFGLADAAGDAEEKCAEVVLNLLNSKLDVKLRPEQIAVAHRVRSRAKPAPMIVRFSDHATKMAVMRQRKTMKGSGKSIGEDLCRDLMEVYNRVKNDPRVSGVWAWNGQVFVKDLAGTVHSVLYGQRLSDIIKNAPAPQDTETDEDDDGKDDPPVEIGNK